MITNYPLVSIISTDTRVIAYILPESRQRFSNKSTFIRKIIYYRHVIRLKRTTDHRPLVISYFSTIVRVKLVCLVVICQVTGKLRVCCVIPGTKIKRGCPIRKTKKESRYRTSSPRNQGTLNPPSPAPPCRCTCND